MDYYDDIDNSYFASMEQWANESTEDQLLRDELEVWMGEEWVDDENHKDILLGGDVEQNPGEGTANAGGAGRLDLTTTRADDNIAVNVTDPAAGGGPPAQDTPLDNAGSGGSSRKPVTLKRSKGKEKTDGDPGPEKPELTGDWLSLALEIETQRRILGKTLPYMDIAEQSIIKQTKPVEVIKHMLESHFEKELEGHFPAVPIKKSNDKHRKLKCHTCGGVGHSATHCPQKKKWKPVSRNSTSKVARGLMDWEAQIKGQMDALKEMKEDDSDSDSSDSDSDDEEPEPAKPGYDRDPLGGFQPPEVHMSNVDKTRLFKLNWRRPAPTLPNAFNVTLIAGTLMALKKCLWGVPLTHTQLCTKLYNFAYENATNVAVSERHLRVLATCVQSGSSAGLSTLCQAWNLSPNHTPIEALQTLGAAPVIKSLLFGATLGLVVDLTYSYLNGTVPYVRNNPIVNRVLGVPQYNYKLKFQRFIGDPYSIESDKRHDMIAMAECKHYNPIAARLRFSQTYGPFKRTYSFSAYMGVVVQVANFANLHDGMDVPTSKAKVEATLSRLGTVNYSRFSQLENDSPIENVKTVCGMIREAHKYHSLQSQNFQNPGGYELTSSERGMGKSASLQSQISSLAPNSENWKSYCLVGLLSLSALGLMYGKQPYSIRIPEIGTQCKLEHARDLLQLCLKLITPLQMSSGSSLKTSVSKGLLLYAQMLILMSKLGSRIADTLESARQSC